MEIKTTRIIIIAIITELTILLFSYLQDPSLENTFRYAARYSGRYSLLLFIYTFFLFAQSYPNAMSSNIRLRSWTTLFTACHLIHFIFLAACVRLNNIPLEGVKVIGGALAYIMIAAAPYFLHRVTRGFQLIYFFYVSLVMSLTYLARIKGEFQGAEPSVVHFIGIGLMLLSWLIFGIIIFGKSRRIKTAG